MLVKQPKYAATRDVIVPGAKGKNPSGHKTEKDFANLNSKFFILIVKFNYFW